MWLVGVVSRRRVWLVGVGGMYGCGCKEVYRFPHITYPYSSCICFFAAAASPTFCSFKKMFFVLVPVHFCNLFNTFLRSINKHMGDYGHPTEAE